MERVSKVSAIHPIPKEVLLNGDKVSLACGVVVHGRDELRPLVERVLVPVLEHAGTSYIWNGADGTGYPIYVGEPVPGDETAHSDTARLGDEGYVITVTRSGASVISDSRRGTLYALLSLGRMIDGSELECGTVVDSPDFAYRGIVEGFFGRPYSHAARLDLVEYTARLKMNTYLYGPKDDPYHRARWREPYAEWQMGEFAQLVECAQGLGMTFGWAAGPGLTVRYSDSRDIDAMVYKFVHMAEVGVRLFAIFYDDIFGRVQHAEDRAAFGSLARAQADFTCRVWNRLQKDVPDARLMVCPTEYRGDGGSDYIVELAAGVPQEIPLLWTGRDVCSRTISAADTRALAERLGRPPAYWDNYPVNDASMVFDLHIGPLRGRDTALGEVVWGLLANPMGLAEAGKVPLFTVADYLWNSRDYDPETSWRSALQYVDPACADAWELIFDHMHRSCLSDADAPGLDAVVARYNERCRDGNASVSPLIRYFDDLRGAYDSVFGPDVNRKLLRDVSPWISRLYRMQTVTTDVAKVLGMASGEVPLDLEVVERMRHHVLGDVDVLRDCSAPHVGYRTIEALALRALAVSEDILRGDLDGARRIVNEPIAMVDWQGGF